MLFLLGYPTPLKLNMEPENQPLEKEIPIGNPSFSGSMLNFGRVHEISRSLGEDPWNSPLPRLPLFHVIQGAFSRTCALAFSIRDLWDEVVGPGG